MASKYLTRGVYIAQNMMIFFNYPFFPKWYFFPQVWWKFFLFLNSSTSSPFAFKKKNKSSYFPPNQPIPQIFKKKIIHPCILNFAANTKHLAANINHLKNINLNLKMSFILNMHPCYIPPLHLNLFELFPHGQSIYLPKDCYKYV